MLPPNVAAQRECLPHLTISESQELGRGVVVFLALSLSCRCWDDVSRGWQEPQFLAQGSSLQATRGTAGQRASPGAMMQEKAREVTPYPLRHSHQLLFSSRVTKTRPYLRGGQLSSTSWGQEYQRIWGYILKQPCTPTILSFLAFYFLLWFFKTKS